MNDSIWRQPEIIVFALTMLIGLLSSIIGTIIWFVRLEGRINYEGKEMQTRANNLEEGAKLLHKRIDETKEKHEEMEDRIFNKMNAMEVTLGEISGYLRRQSEKS